MEGLAGALHEKQQDPGDGQGHQGGAQHLPQHQHREILLTHVGDDAPDEGEQGHAHAVVEQRLAFDDGGDVFGQAQLVHDAGSGDGIRGGHDASQQNADPDAQIPAEQPGGQIEQHPVQRRGQGRGQEGEQGDVFQVAGKFVEMHLAGPGEEHEAQYAVEQVRFKTETAEALQRPVQALQPEAAAHNPEGNAAQKGKEQQGDVVGHFDEALVEQADDGGEQNHQSK